MRADLDDACLVGTIWKARISRVRLSMARWAWCRGNWRAPTCEMLRCPSRSGNSTGGRNSGKPREPRQVTLWPSPRAAWFRWLLIWSTRDIQLLTDSAVLRFLHSRAAATAMPAAESYLIIPAALFIVYLIFQFHLQQVWASVMVLPAVFPDGEVLGEHEPAIVRSLLRAHFRWMSPDPAQAGFAERAGAMLLAYWMLPLTLMLFWARYLTRQEMHGSLLQAALFATAAGLASYATTKVGCPHESWTTTEKWTDRLTEKLRK